jgi:hypothetical protein
MRLVDLLTTLRPLLLERGLISSSGSAGRSGKSHRKQIVMRNHSNRTEQVPTTEMDRRVGQVTQQASFAATDSSDGDNSMQAEGKGSGAVHSSQHGDQTWGEGHKAKLVQELMEGRLSVLQYIQLSRLE